jgi:hypothetical protein
MAAITRSRHQARRTASVRDRVMYAASRLPVAVLAVFHVWLLWTHATTGKLFEADVAGRWGVAVLVAASFWWLSRLGVPLVRGRRALVLWMLVLLIHGHAAWTGDAWREPVTVPAGIVELLPAGLSLATTVVSVLFLAALALRRLGPPALPAFSDLPVRLAGVPAPVAAFRFSPRPPPSR